MRMPPFQLPPFLNLPYLGRGQSVFRKRAFHLNVPFSPVPCACHLSLLLSFLWTKGTSRKACLSTPGDSKTCFSQSADSVTCGALGREKGWHLVRYQCDTRKALYERHFCQEDVNGEKITMEKWWIFGADFFMVYAEFFTVYKGHKR